jgi:phosphopantothenoylcysteine decarboxylase/phosphopantothenate--cysteine ligase
MCAAVADFSPESVSACKIEKSQLQGLRLKANPDILAEVSAMADRPFVCGFSAETGERLDRARRKMREKGADMFVFNDVTREGSGFDADTNEVTVMDGLGQESLPLMSKEDAAAAILDRIIKHKRGG